MKGVEVKSASYSDCVNFTSPVESTREFADTENKQWVQERLLDYYHGSRG